ncbi:hypothetical protein Hanom_Chr17g01572901 [Helianthus anomalus]
MMIKPLGVSLMVTGTQVKPVRCLKCSGSNPACRLFASLEWLGSHRQAALPGR